jgi:hypothetical protein
MRARPLFALLAAMALALAVAGPAAAKGAIAEANISGPGLGGGGGMRIEAPATDRMWDSGIDVGGGLDDTRSESISEFGLVSADLGPKYLVTYRFDFGPGSQDDLIRQDLYPYAKGGPVTYTPLGQELTGEGMDAPITSGWFQAEPGFLEFSVENGLPATNPVAAATSGEPAAEPARQTQPVPWVWILLGLAGLAALSLTAPGVRRRVLVAVTRVNH